MTISAKELLDAEQAYEEQNNKRNIAWHNLQKAERSLHPLREEHDIQSYSADEAYREWQDLKKKVQKEPIET